MSVCCWCSSEESSHHETQHKLLLALFCSPAAALQQGQLQSGPCSIDHNSASLATLISALRAHGVRLSAKTVHELRRHLQDGRAVVEKVPFLLLVQGIEHWPEGGAISYYTVSVVGLQPHALLASPLLLPFHHTQSIC